MTGEQAESGGLGLQQVCVELGLPITTEQLSALSRYVDLLQRWNRVYNLTAVRDPEAMVSQHLADCLAAVASLRRHLLTGRVLDVGSGGGLPGAVAAILLPDVEVVCVDSVAKKAAFIQQVAGALALPNLTARHSRVEHLRAGSFDVITARAFAALSFLCDLTRAHLSTHGVWMAMKGRVPDEEIAALSADVEVFHVEQLTVPGLDAQRCLIWMRDCQSAGQPCS